MKINQTHILNWQSPGDQWWDSIAARPDEPLIEVRFDLTMSEREYLTFLRTAERPADQGVAFAPGEKTTMEFSMSTARTVDCGELKQIHLPWWKRKLMDLVFRGA